jgi:uncharacterized SAM-binding protein YcdF (DUF218 family)
MREETALQIGRTLLRWAVGTVVVGALIIIGTAARIVLVGHSDRHSAADAILVMGAAQYDGTPSPVFKARLDHAAALYRAGVASHVVTVGGGQPGDRVTESAAGRQYLITKGVPAASVIAVGEGNDTLVSLRSAAPALRAHGWDSIVLVTDPWHSERAGMMARDLGFHTQTSPVTSGPATDPSVRNRYILRETLGTLFYRLTGGSSGAGTAVF